MKKSAVLILALFFTLGVNAQQEKVVNAYTYLRSGQLDKAKIYIDAAIKNDKTSVLAKTWFYRGNIYLKIHLADPIKDKKYKDLDTNAIQIAYDCYQKAIEIDKDISNENLMPSVPALGLIVIGSEYFNMGVEFYNKKQFDQALGLFEKSKKINETFLGKDTLATFNAALCAVTLKDTKKAKLYLEQLIKMNYKQTTIYTQLSNIYKAEGDTTKAFNILEKGRKQFPNDLNIIIGQINYYLSKGKSKEAQDLLDVAVSKDPNNPNLHFAIGVNMDEVGNFVEAEKSYKKAIEIKQDFFDAYYNLGALYVNSALNKMQEADKLPIGDPKYDELKKVADGLFAQAVPILEKAHQLNPKDKNTLISLKQLYSKLSMFEKVKEVEEKIKGLK